MTRKDIFSICMEFFIPKLQTFQPNDWYSLFLDPTKYLLKLLNAINQDSNLKTSLNSFNFIAVFATVIKFEKIIILF